MEMGFNICQYEGNVSQDIPYLASDILTLCYSYSALIAGQDGNAQLNLAARV